MRSEQFGAVHFTYRPTVNQYPMYVAKPRALRKSKKGGLCDKNGLPQSVRVCGLSYFVNARVFLYWRTKNMEVKLYETIN